MTTRSSTNDPVSPAGGMTVMPAPPRPTRRGAELALLAFAAVITTSALALVEANQEQAVTLDLLRYGLAYLALFAVAHLAVRRLAPYADPLILPCVALLNGLGLVLIHRLDLAELESARQLGEAAPSADATQQVVWTAAGVLLFLAVLLVVRDHRSIARYGYTLGLAAIVALAIPAVLPARFSEVNGAKIWIRVPGFSIQPGEFAKIGVIIFVASFLVGKRDLFTTAGRHLLGMDLPRLRDLGPLLVAWGLSIAVLVLESDFGTSFLIFGTVLVMLYVATERIGWLVVGAGFLAAGGVLAYFAVNKVQVRVSTWLHPFDSYATTGYQISQSLFGLGTGGLAGTGLGAGRPDQVPFAKTDFIMSTVGEELGLVGVGAVLMVFALIILRGFRNAVAVRDTFGKLLASGLAFTMALQVFVVVGGVTKLIPLTGLTTPFLSYGGSSLVANYALVAILLRISDAARRPPEPRSPRVQPAPEIADAPTAMVVRPT
ncbi:MAG: FtsW/RodA/SpoVE family cell cycle protein [Mycobacteriaceae bacterium]